ncbi:MAG: FliH/SctL family protein [Firmicutes bacterium]|nr:FliH/SctL family protein [Bacillota bacterium]
MINTQVVRLNEDQISPVTPEILDTGQSLVDLRDRARHEGYEDGYQAGQEKAAEEAAISLQSFQENARQVFAALAEALENAKNLLNVEQQKLEQYAAKLSVEIAESILDHEVETGQISVLDTIQHALAMLPQGGEVIGRVNPVDLEFIQSGDLFPSLRLVPDQSVQRSGCILEIGSAMVDARLDIAIQRVRKELRLKAGVV